MNHLWSKRWPLGLLVLAVLMTGLSGCSGSARAASWTGLTVAGETLYAADVEQVVALNGADGSVVWAFPQNPKEERRGLFYAAPAVDESHVIAASQVPASGFLSRPKNIVWGLSRETGTLQWHFDLAAGQYVEGGAISGDTFVIGNSDGNVYALDVNSGALRWTLETGHRVWATPLIVSDTVYIGAMDHNLYALDLATGRLKWKFQAGGAFASTPALADGVLYSGAFDNHLYAIDAETGAELWHFSSNDWFWGSPLVYSDTVYATDVGGRVYAVETESGHQIWKSELETKVRAGPALSADGRLLLVGGQNGTLYALDVSDGYVIWSRDGQGQVLSTPVVNGDVVYELAIYGSYHIRALHVDNGRDMWAYPPQTED